MRKWLLNLIADAIVLAFERRKMLVNELAALDFEARIEAIFLSNEKHNEDYGDFGGTGP